MNTITNSAPSLFDDGQIGSEKLLRKQLIRNLI